MLGYLLDTFLDSSTEEQDQWIAEHTAEISAIEGRVKFMADKPTNRERLQQITAGIEQGIKELFESEKYKASPARKVAKALDNPTLHALEDAVPLPEPEQAFTVYEDIRQKLIAQGMPADQIAFIHEANTEVRKKELFSKVRTGRVRVLLGSTQKMGAGTNVQDRLVALHDLDCPWRPGDLA